MVDLRGAALPPEDEDPERIPSTLGPSPETLMEFFGSNNLIPLSIAKFSTF
jgi:hypothetical protein